MEMSDRRRVRRVLSWGLGAGLAAFLCGVVPLLPGPRLLHPLAGVMLFLHTASVLPLLLAGLALPVFGIAALLSARPRWALPGLVLCVALGLSVGAGILGGAAVRRVRFSEAAERARPLIGALETFRARGGYPEALEDVTRGTMERPPYTGLLAYPEFEYRRSGPDFDVPGYELRVSCPMGPMSFDVFVYRPGRSYPERLYGGRVERIGDWAYVRP